MRKAGGDEEPAFNKPREDLARSQKKKKAKNEKGQCYRADAEMQALSNSQGFRHYFSSPVFFWLRNEQHYSPLPAPGEIAKKGVRAAAVKNHLWDRADLEPCSGSCSFQVTQRAGGLVLGIAISPFERNTFRLLGQCGKIGFISQENPADGQWLPGTSSYSLVPWLNNDVCYGQKMKNGTTHVTY